jgi:hypothetical protein
VAGAGDLGVDDIGAGDLGGENLGFCLSGAGDAGLGRPSGISFLVLMGVVPRFPDGLAVVFADDAFRGWAARLDGRTLAESPSRGRGVVSRWPLPAASGAPAAWTSRPPGFPELRAPLIGGLEMVDVVVAAMLQGRADVCLSDSFQRRGGSG